MRYLLKATVASIATAIALAGPASAELTREFKDQPRYIQSCTTRNNGNFDCKIPS